MVPEVSKLLLIAAAVTVLVGLAVIHYRRGWGAVIALAGLSAIGAGLATQLLFPDFFFGTNDPEAKVWKDRYDFVQRDLQISREKELAARRSLEDTEKAGQKLRLDLEQEKRAHAAIRTALEAEVLARQRANSLREGAEKAEHDARATVEKLESLANALRSEIARLEAALSSQQAANLKLSEDFNTTKERATKDIDDLKTEKKAVETERDKVLVDLSTARESLATIEKALLVAQQTIRELKLQPTPPPALPPDLRGVLEDGIFGRRYEIYRALHPPTISGRAGTYYAVKLRAARSEPFEFEIGKYTLTSGDDAFLESVHDFVEGIIRKIHGHIAWELFIRGTADEREFKEPPSTVGQEEFSIVQYLPKEQPDTSSYLNVPKDQKLGPLLRNENLPILRAAYVAKLFRKPLSQLQALGPRPTILEETPRGPPRNLNPELFLLISW